MRASSCKLSMLRAMSLFIQVRKSCSVFEGESKIMFWAEKPAVRAINNSPGLATSAPIPYSRKGFNTLTKALAFTAKVWKKLAGKAA